MTLPQPIVAHHKRASEHQDPFGPWCKLHHAFFTHLAEARLSGAAYKVVLQVLCASFHFGQYHPAALSLDQFQSSQHLGRKAVIEGLRQAVARGILYEERGWQTGAHAPKQYGLVFYRVLTERGQEHQSARHQVMTLLKGGAWPSSEDSTFEPDQVLPQKETSSSSILEPRRPAVESFEGTTGRETEPVEGEQPVPVIATGAEIEPVPVRQPHQHWLDKRTAAGAVIDPEAAQQGRWGATSPTALEKEERTDYNRIPASLVPPPEPAQKDQADLGEDLTVLYQRSLSPAEAAAPSNGSSSNHLASEIATLREEYERRQAALSAWHPHGVEQIQAKIAARLEVRRLERQIEELETALALQDQSTQEREDPCVAGQPERTDGSTAKGVITPEGPSTLPLHVAEEHLTLWRADVVAQRHEVTRVTAQYQAVTEQLQQCHIGRGNWGALVREQRFLAGDLEEQKAQLARYERFVALIEQGATKEEAWMQVLDLRRCDAFIEQGDSCDAFIEQSDTENASSAALPAEDQPPAEPAPKLEGQQLRKALFTTLAQVFTNGDPRHIDLERGKFNRAIKKLVAVDVQPEDVPVLQATFERLWPKATCTALGIANNLPILIDRARMFGWQLR